MTDTAVEPVTVLPTVESAAKAEVRLSRWQSFGLALGSLVLVFGLGLVVMLAGGAVIHALKPTRHVDIFAALHNRWVVGALLGIALLWLLPPHPWAKRVMASGSQEQPAKAGRTEDGGGGASTVHLVVPGPGPVHRPTGGQPG
ncbi:MAG: hypothetical protein M0Z46_02045 [Actinomycetota bacterium]|jgi:hypothetical protein|nr:hypothetical protein [Actinomycetota bacterium]